MDYYRANELLDYNPDTGEFIWKVTRSGRALAGSKTGCLNHDGYVTLKLDYKRYLAHRVAWLLYYGYIPENDIDHINRNRSDNRIENLREVSDSCNIYNCSISKRNKSNIIGVFFSSDRDAWRSCIRVNKRLINLGTFVDFTEAVAHRLAAEQALGIDFYVKTTAEDYIRNYLNRSVDAQTLPE